MARLPRIVVPGQPQHVIVRGNDRSEIFRADADYGFYLEKLKAACDKHGCQLHAYTLMTNHVHLLVTPETEQSLAKALQMLGRYYVQYFNLSYRRAGTLWEGRYKATLIDSESYLLTCMRYIELNPVRAGMVLHPSEYRWSSYRYNALGQVGDLVTPHLEYRRLDKSAETRQAAYRQLFRHRIAERSVTAIRDATNKAWVGQRSFQETRSAATGASSRAKRAGWGSKVREVQSQARLTY